MQAHESIFDEMKGAPVATPNSAMEATHFHASGVYATNGYFAKNIYIHDDFGNLVPVNFYDFVDSCIEYRH